FSPTLSWVSATPIEKIKVQVTKRIRWTKYVSSLSVYVLCLSEFGIEVEFINRRELLQGNWI
ncbi:MAG: hypothetical protein ACI8YC_000597, partial [Salibacteraceae bacterium]